MDCNPKHDIDPSKWLYDWINKDLIQLHNITGVVYRGQTKFQSIEIVQTGSFGKCLVLDGKIQSCEGDEFIYHEAIVQPAMVTHPRPEKVFIAGGGEGATLRDVLYHPTVKRAVMIDIDGEVVAACKKYLPEYSRGAFDDKRAEVRHEDARAYLARSKEKFDVMIIDLPEPIEGGPAYLLFTTEFYQLALEHLTPSGTIGVQAGLGAFNELLNFAATTNTLKSVFKIVRPYYVDVPSYGGAWGFCFASNTLDPTTLTPSSVDKVLDARGIASKLRCYDGLCHQAFFSLPKHMRYELAQITRVMADSSPLYVCAPK